MGQGFQSSGSRCNKDLPLARPMSVRLWPSATSLFQASTRRSTMAFSCPAACASISVPRHLPTVDSCRGSRGKRHSRCQTGDDTRHNRGVHGVLTDNHASIRTARGDRTETERKQPYRPPSMGTGRTATATAVPRKGIRPVRARHPVAAEAGNTQQQQHRSPPHARSPTTSGLNFESTAPAGRPMLFCCGSPRFKSSLVPCVFG